MSCSNHNKQPDGTQTHVILLQAEAGLLLSYTDSQAPPCNHEPKGKVIKPSLTLSLSLGAAVHLVWFGKFAHANRRKQMQELRTVRGKKTKTKQELTCHSNTFSSFIQFELHFFIHFQQSLHLDQRHDRSEAWDGAPVCYKTPRTG